MYYNVLLSLIYVLKYATIYSDLDLGLVISFIYLLCPYTCALVILPSINISQMLMTKLNIYTFCPVMIKSLFMTFDL